MEGADSCNDEDSARMARLAHQEWSGKGFFGLYMHVCALEIWFEFSNTEDWSGCSVSLHSYLDVQDDMF